MAAATFDPNTWYAISEHRVDNVTSNPLSGCLQFTGSNFNVFGRNDQDWQLQPVDGVAGRYMLRTNKKGPLTALAACHRGEEAHPNRTGICYVDGAAGDSAQKWDISNWGDGSFRLANVANGSGFVLDVHPGAAVFMNDLIENSGVPQPAQHWIFSSDKPVNDGAYSTVYSVCFCLPLYLP